MAFSRHLVLSLGLVLSLAVSGEAQAPNTNACAYIDGFNSFCANISPSWTLLPAKTQASCLCYQDGGWTPDNYDNAASQCAAYLASASPALVASLTSAAGHPPITTLCRGAGNVRNAPIFTPDANKNACMEIINGVSLCNNIRPGFTTFPFISQASCLCYNSLGSWVPKTYDNLWGSCLSYYKTVTESSIRSAYSAVLSSNGGVIDFTPCAALGNILAQTTPNSPGIGASSTPPAVSPVSSIALSTPGASSTPNPSEDPFSSLPTSSPASESVPTTPLTNPKQSSTFKPISTAVSSSGITTVSVRLLLLGLMTSFLGLLLAEK